MSQTIHFGNDTTEFPLNVVNSNGNTVTISIIKSEAVTAEAVYNVAKDADSYTVTTDGTVAPTQTGYKYSSISYGDTITVKMVKLSQLEINDKEEKTRINELATALSLLNASLDKKEA